MKRAEYIEMVNSVYSIDGDRPFADYPDVIVFRHTDNKKWFAAMMTIPKSKLGIPDDSKIDIVNVKCAQEIIDSIWEEKGIYPAYHMNKKHWVTMVLDENTSDDTIKFLTNISYDLTKTNKRASRK